MRWFRFHTDAVDDEKLRLLAFEDRWHFVAILCCKSNGLLEQSPIMRRKVAVKLGLDLRELDEVARRLSEVGLIDPDSLEPLAWKKRQFESDLSTERVRKWREKHAPTSQKRCGNVSETPPDTDTDTENTLPTVVVGKADAYRPPDCPFQELLNAYHELCPSLSRIRVMTSARQANTRARWGQVCVSDKFTSEQAIDWFRWFFSQVEKSDFLCGRSKSERPWRADFEWLMKAGNFAKVVEGKYGVR